MSGDGDARGLEAAAAAAAEAARELREAAAALVATRAAEEDALRRRAVALDADVRRLQGSLHGLDPSTLDKVEEELERARVAITDSDVASFLPSKRNGKFLRKFLGPVNVRVARKEDRLKIKDEYNNYRDRTAYKFLLFPSILLLLRWWIWDGCLPALAVQIYQAWLLYLYTSFALRENVLIANGSDIRPWWIYHHYLAMLMALISLTWEIKGQPDCSSKQRGVQLFLRWAIMQGIAMHLQNRYQRQRLRTRIALGKDVDEYYDWEKYRLIFSCYETDEAYVKYWDQLTKKMKWVDDALLLGHKEFSMRYDDRGGRQAVKIAAGLCHLPASLATRGYEEYVLARQYDLDCRKGYDLVYFEVWKRISKQEMSFKEALKDILSSENKLSSSCLFRIQAEIKGCGLMRRNYSICMDDIQKLVVKGGEGAVSKKHFTDAVYSKIPIPKLYVDYAKKKLEVARRIHLMPGTGSQAALYNVTTSIYWIPKAFTTDNDPLQAWAWHGGLKTVNLTVRMGQSIKYRVGACTHNASIIYGT